jgi:hypothetical protein
LTFSITDAIALALMTFLLVLGGQAVRLLWDPTTSSGYVDRLGSAFPWASKTSIRRFAAAVPSVVMAMAGLVLAVAAGFVGAANETSTTVVTLAVATVAIGLGAFGFGLVAAVSAGCFGRPRAVIPPPLRQRGSESASDHHR